MPQEKEIKEEIRKKWEIHGLYCPKTDEFMITKKFLKRLKDEKVIIIKKWQKKKKEKRKSL